MERQRERDLQILSAIDEGQALTQRALSEQLGVALGLTNLYLKRLAKKGLIKITEFPRKPSARKRLRYVLTPKGIMEKSRLTYDYIGYSLGLYRRTRETLRGALSQLYGNGMKRIALYGVGEAAELAYITLKEFGIEPTGVFWREPGDLFLGFRVRDLAELADGDIDGVVVATFERPEPRLAELQRLGIPPQKLLCLRRPLPAGPQRTNA